MEYWDAFDENLFKIPDVTLVRGEPIPEGMYHLVCDVLVKHADETYLLMQRAPEKTFGGMWEATAGGAAIKGETPLGCAIRELQEETGILSSDLRHVGTIIKDSTIYMEYVCFYAGRKDVRLQKGETVDYKWVTREELADMRKQGNLITQRMSQFVSEIGEQ